MGWGSDVRVIVAVHWPLLAGALEGALRDAGHEPVAPADAHAATAVWVVDRATAGVVPADAAAVLLVGADAGAAVGLDGTVDQIVAALEAGGAGDHVPDRASAAPTLADELTDRELEIVERVVRGWTNQQVADDLGITANTVRTHLQNIMPKVGVTSRRGLAAVVVT